jgi:hypothetical protein
MQTVAYQLAGTGGPRKPTATSNRFRDHELERSSPVEFAEASKRNRL